MYFRGSDFISCLQKAEGLNLVSYVLLASNRRDLGRLWSFHPKIIKSFSFAALLKYSTLKNRVPEGIKPLVRHSKGFSLRISPLSAMLS